MDEKTRVARELYRYMPGSRISYSANHWEEVKSTAEWRFCEAIAEAMLNVALRAAEVTAKATVKRMKEEQAKAKAETDAIPNADDWSADFGPENLADLVDDAAEAVLK